MVSTTLGRQQMREIEEENYFKIEDNVLIYEEEKSSGYIYARVADGERFICDCDLWKDAVNGNSDQKVLYDSNFRFV